MLKEKKLFTDFLPLSLEQFFEMKTFLEECENQYYYSYENGGNIIYLYGFPFTDVWQYKEMKEKKNDN